MRADLCLVCDRYDAEDLLRDAAALDGASPGAFYSARVRKLSAFAPAAAEWCAAARERGRGRGGGGARRGGGRSGGSGGGSGGGSAAPLFLDPNGDIDDPLYGTSSSSPYPSFSSSLSSNDGDGDLDGDLDGDGDSDGDEECRALRRPGRNRRAAAARDAGAAPVPAQARGAAAPLRGNDGAGKQGAAVSSSSGSSSSKKGKELRRRCRQSDSLCSLCTPLCDRLSCARCCLRRQSEVAADPLLPWRSCRSRRRGGGQCGKRRARRKIRRRRRRRRTRAAAGRKGPRGRKRRPLLPSPLPPPRLSTPSRPPRTADGRS